MKWKQDRKNEPRVVVIGEGVVEVYGAVGNVVVVERVEWNSEFKQAMKQY